ncbi:MAG: GNAT family N-acetyltransferase [Myxococcales bacterium]|nr:GNAT family N-acetyltransferase [Myxococcales bacterium]
MPVRIRRADEADIPFLAGVVVAAARSHVSRGLFDLLVPDDDAARRAFAEALLRARPSWCHWQNFHVAEVAGERAAALSGYPVGDVDLAPPEQVLPEVARGQGFSDDELAAAFLRVGPFASCFLEDDPEAWAVEWVATDPRFRGHGLCGTLLERVLGEGRARGHATSQLLILIGNTPAQRVYEKHGFRIVDEKRTTEFEAAIGCPGLARMERREEG